MKIELSMQVLVDKVGTLYVRTEMEITSFLRFYNKYLDVIDKEARKQEDNVFLVIGTGEYESELKKFDVTSMGQKFL